MADLKNVLVIGYGALGGRVVDELARTHPDTRIWVVGRDEEKLLRRVNLARYASYHARTFAEIEPVMCDALDPTALRRLFTDNAFDLVFNATSMIPWWRIDLLPPQTRASLKAAGTGIWAAVDILPVLKLMEGMAAARFQGLFVNGTFADLVNAVVYDDDLGPVAGTGNVANVVPAVAYSAADLLGISVKRVAVRLVAHHFLSYNIPVTGSTEGAPSIVQVLVDGEDVTKRLSPTALYKNIPRKFRRVKGIGGEAVATSSAMAVLTPLITGERALTHAPGVRGLPGGYPVRVEHRMVELDLPTGTDQNAAVATNLAGGRWDGIEAITPDRTVLVTDKAADIARSMLGYDAAEVGPANAEVKAFELLDRFERLVAAQGAA